MTDTGYSGKTLDVDESGYLVFDLDEDELRKLESDAGAEDRALLSRPEDAARAFGAALGLPASTDYELLEVSDEPEDGPGVYLARVRASGVGALMAMRLISDPGAGGRPSYWLLNDVETEPGSGGLP